ncbi:sensor domain-containing diguanylate cyclase [Euzebya tangerina]|uniref:GGDEF domain-containing protein n=1 Tax=Euzebya tangerina TaxID=591198 RepID=UPI000E3138CD|nr:diguanylate cyclase [Euzebya tangerina]
MTSLSLRAKLLILAGVPLLVAVIALAALALRAQADARVATAEVEHLDDLAVLTDIEAALRAESWLYRLRIDNPGGGPVPDEVGLTFAHLAEQSDASMATIEAADLTVDEQRAVTELYDRLIAVRQAIADQDLRAGSEALGRLHGELAFATTAARASRVAGLDSRWLGLAAAQNAVVLAGHETADAMWRLHVGAFAQAAPPGAPGPQAPRQLLGPNNATREKLAEARIWINGGIEEGQRPPAPGEDPAGPWRQVLRDAQHSGQRPFDLDEAGVADLLRLSDAYRADVSLLADQITDDLYADAASRADQAQRTGLISLGALISVVIAVITATISVLRRLTRRVDTLVESATQIAEGDFSLEAAAIGTDDEIGRIAGAMDEIRTSLQLVDDQLHALAEGDLTAPVLSDGSAGGLGQRLRLAVGELNRSTSDLIDAAHQDPLTGLLNRAGLDKHTEPLRAVDDLAVLTLDLDGFKPVNDAYGHAVGDELLCQVADRLKSAVRPEDAVARTGGDEFVVVLAGVDPEAASAMATRLAEVVAEPIDGTSAGHTINVGVSVGRAMVADGEALSDALERADQAMYARKRSRQPVFQ